MTVSLVKTSDHVDRLARKVQALAQAKAPSDRVLIGISGIPGSGKSTFAAAVAARVNQFEKTGSDLAICVPMDGYHLSRAESTGHLTKSLGARDPYPKSCERQAHE
ncbi:hypothetical protein BJX65DRAFT_49888 [Aspergillus insuetus]